MRMLVVDDQSKMARFLEQGLTNSGYSVDVAHTGAAAEALAAKNPYDLVLLDVMLPDTNGFDIARHLRSRGFRNPILILTALDGTKDKVHGLDAGADDYLTKPFEFDELLARIRALLRRQTRPIDSILRYGDIEMDLINRKTRRNGHEIGLTPKEFALLEYLLRNPERPLSRNEISEHVWNAHFDSDSNVIDVYINMLRKKVDHPFETKLLHTIVGAGYALKQ